MAGSIHVAGTALVSHTIKAKRVLTTTAIASIISTQLLVVDAVANTVT